MVEASPEMHRFFEEILGEVNRQHAVASQARKKGYDADSEVEIKLAENMAQRVVGIISVVAPQIAGSGVVERIIELEKQYGALDWRVSLQIGLEIAQEKFCKFQNKKEAMEIGIRTGFAYSTVGVVSSPLDGFIGMDIKKRMDGRGEYFCLNYAGPIRNAGGTNAAVSALIADYIRKKMGYDVYDAQDVEIKRSISEIRDYDERIAPRQHKPSDDELTWLFKNMPVEISGDPSEIIEVSNYKDLPRIPTNRIRSGFALMCTDCIPLKAPKLWKQLSAWGKEFDLMQWNFLENLIKLQKEAKAKGEGQNKQEETTLKIKPNYGFIADLVAGRPVFTHPLRKGGFRLRYGRARTSGYSALATHPSTMYVANKYLAVGTQIKIERPSKGGTLTACSILDGPIIKTKDGSVVELNNLKKAKEYEKEIDEVLFFGDLLISYGDFFNRASALVPAGYCQEWWIQELEKSIVNSFGALDLEKSSEHVGIPVKKISALIESPISAVISAEDAVALSKAMAIPMHPKYTYYWTELTEEMLLDLVKWMSEMKITRDTAGKIEKIVFPNNNEKAKRALELLGIPHQVVNKQFIVLDKSHSLSFFVSFGLDTKSLPEIQKLIEDSKGKGILEIINLISGVKIRDRSGTYIGARMGRPEKAKMRKLTGSPHVLFPVGAQGGKFRCFQSALDAGVITAEFPTRFCKNCKIETLFPVCENCELKTEAMHYCRKCSKFITAPYCKATEKDGKEHGPAQECRKKNIDIQKYFNYCLKKLGMKTYPDLIKGVKGTSNKEHIPEHLAKGILRAKHELFVNKDGTIRYDMTQLPITHFKPVEIGTGIDKLKQMGYLKDIHGKELTEDNQILELKPQDVILPNCDESPEEGAAKVLLRVAQFVDDLLVSFYGLSPYYGLDSEKDLVGHLVICLAPHTSAGIAGRIIGFSKTQGFFAHPLLHAATRRDCDGDEACVILLLDAFLNFSKKYLPASRGSTMDAPLVLTSVLNPSEVDDMAFHVDIPWRYPLELYEAALEYKNPWDVKIKKIGETLNTPSQYEGMGFTHDTVNINNAVRCSAYKTLPSMEEKLKGQMDIAEKLRAVDESDVARLVIEKHFLKDTKGNLRKFSMQEFRCVNCNEKYRRPPLAGKCTNCKNGKIIFTISEGSVVKYLEPTISLAKKYKVSPYLQQTIDLLKMRIESVFGKEKEKQSGLGAWFG